MKHQQYPTLTSYGSCKEWNYIPWWEEKKKKNKQLELSLRFVQHPEQ